MDGEVFVDTNVLVYSRDSSEPEKQPRAAEWLALLWRSRGRLSYQVLSEYYVTVTRKLKPGMAPEDGRQDARNLLAWSPWSANQRVLEEAWELQDRFGLEWWDALIVSSARQAGCALLLSEDFQDGQVFGPVRVIDPFRHGPGSAGL